MAWSIIGLALVALGAWLVLSRLRLVLIVVGSAVVIVLVLEPVVSRLVRARVPRWAAATIVMLVLLLPAGLGLWRLAQILLRELAALLEAAPDLLARLSSVANLVRRELFELGIPLPAEDPIGWLEQNQEVVVTWAVDAATGATRLVLFLLALLVGGILAFYALVTLPTVKKQLVSFVPLARRERVREILSIVGGSVGAFFRGQLLIAAAVGAMSIVGLALLGVPSPVLIGTIAGISNLVPFLGPIVGSVPGVVLGWAAGGPWLALWVIVLFVVVQQIESHLLSPLILGATMRLSPVLVIVGLLVGAVVAGIPGMLLAIPALAAAKALYERFGPPRDHAQPAEGGLSSGSDAGRPSPIPRSPSTDRS